MNRMKVILILIIFTSFIGVKTTANQIKALEAKFYQINQYNLYNGNTHELTFEIKYRNNLKLNGFIKITPENNNNFKIIPVTSTCFFEEPNSSLLGKRPLCYVASNYYDPSITINEYQFEFGIANNFLNLETNSFFFRIPDDSDIIKFTILVIAECNIKSYPSFKIRHYSDSTLMPSSLISSLSNVISDGEPVACYPTKKNDKDGYDGSIIFTQHNNFILDDSDKKITEDPSNSSFLSSTFNQGFIYSSKNLLNKSFTLLINVSRSKDASSETSWGFTFAGPWENPKKNIKQNYIYNYLESRINMLFDSKYFSYVEEPTDCYLSWTSNAATYYLDLVGNKVSNLKNLNQKDVKKNATYPQLSNFLKNSSTIIEEQRLVFSQEVIALSNKTLFHPIPAQNSDIPNPNLEIGGYTKNVTFLSDLVNQFIILKNDSTGVTTLTQVKRILDEDFPITPESEKDQYIIADIGVNSNCVKYNNFKDVSNIFQPFEIYINFTDASNNLIRVNRFFKIFAEGFLSNQVSVSVNKELFYYGHKVNSIQNNGVCLIELNESVWNTENEFNVLVLFLHNFTLLETNYVDSVYPAAPLYKSQKPNIIGVNSNVLNLNDEVEEKKIKFVGKLEINTTIHNNFLSSLIYISNINFDKNDKKGYVTEGTKNPGESESKNQSSLYIPVYCNNNNNLKISIIGMKEELSLETTNFEYSYLVHNKPGLNYKTYFEIKNDSNSIITKQLKIEFLDELNISFPSTNTPPPPVNFNMQTGSIFLTKDFNLSLTRYSDKLFNYYSKDELYSSNNLFYFSTDSPFSVLGHKYTQGFIFKNQNWGIINNWKLYEVNLTKFTGNLNKNYNNFTSINFIDNNGALASNLIYEQNKILSQIERDKVYNNYNYSTNDILYYSVITPTVQEMNSEMQMEVNNNEEETDNNQIIGDDFLDYIVVEVLEIQPRVVDFEGIWTVRLNLSNDNTFLSSASLYKINEMILHFKNFKAKNVYCGINGETTHSCYSEIKGEYLLVYVQINSLLVGNEFQIYNIITPDFDVNSSGNFLVKLIDYEIKNSFRNEVYSAKGEFNIPPLSNFLFYYTGKEGYYAQFFEENNNEIFTKNGDEEILETADEMTPPQTSEEVEENNLQSQVYNAYVFKEVLDLNSITTLEKKFFIYKFAFENQELISISDIKKLKDLIIEKQKQKVNIFKQSQSNINFEEGPFYLILQFSENFDFLEYKISEINNLKIYLREYQWYFDGSVHFKPFFSELDAFTSNKKNYNPGDSELLCKLISYSSRMLLIEIKNINFKTHTNFGYFKLTLENLLTPKLPGLAGIESLILTNKNKSVLVTSKKDESVKELEKSDIKFLNQKYFLFESISFSLTSSNMFIINSNGAYTHRNYQNDINTKHEINFIYRKLGKNNNEYKDYVLEGKNFNDIDKKLFYINYIEVWSGRFFRGSVLVSSGTAQDSYASIMVDTTLPLKIISSEDSVIKVSSVKTKVLEIMIGVNCGVLPGKYIVPFKKEEELVTEGVLVKNTTDKTFFYNIPRTILKVNFNDNSGKIILSSYYNNGSQVNSNFGVNLISAGIMKVDYNKNLLLYILVSEPPVDKLNIKVDNHEVEIFSSYNSDESSIFSSQLVIFIKEEEINKDTLQVTLNDGKLECYELLANQILLNKVEVESSNSITYENFDSSSRSELIAGNNIEHNQVKFKFNIDPKIKMQQMTTLFCSFSCNEIKKVDISMFQTRNPSKYQQYLVLNIPDNNLMYDINFKNLIRSQQYHLKCFEELDKEEAKFEIKFKPKNLLETKCFNFIFDKKMLTEINSKLKIDFFYNLKYVVQKVFSKNGFTSDGCVIVVDSFLQTIDGYELPYYKQCSSSNVYTKTYINQLDDKEFKTSNLDDIDFYSLCTLQLPDCPTNINKKSRTYEDALLEISNFKDNTVLSKYLNIPDFKALKDINLISDNNIPNHSDIEIKSFKFDLNKIIMEIKALNSLICYYYVGDKNESNKPSMDEMIDCSGKPYFCNKFIAGKFFKTIESDIVSRDLPVGKYQFFLLCKNNFPFSLKYTDVRVVSEFKKEETAPMNVLGIEDGPVKNVVKDKYERNLKSALIILLSLILIIY